MDPAPVALNQRKTFWITGVNPQPWQVAAPVKGKRKPKFWVKHGALAGYQEAVKEELRALWPYGPFDTKETPVALSFVFWRQIENVQDADGRWHRGGIADATNLQKALEDALQGILFTNDRYVADIRSRIIEQSPYTEPKIGISVKPATGVSLQLELEFVDGR